MSAKFVLSKVLGVGSILIGVLYLAVPSTLISLIGLEIVAVDPIMFIIRMLAVRNIIMGLAMILSTGKLSEHVWLWLISIGALSDAILTSVLWPGVPVRNVLPLWLIAIFLLFGVGVAYGLDVAAAFTSRRNESKIEPEVTQEGSETVQNGEDSSSMLKSADIILAEEKPAEKP